MNNLINIYNRNVREGEKVNLLFIEVPSEVLKSIDFIRLSAHGKIPTGRAGHIRIHDIDHHVISNLIVPSNFHEVALGKTKILTEFYDYLNSNDLLQGEVKLLMDRVVKERAREIDLLADVGAILVRHLSRGQDIYSAFVGSDQVSNYLYSSLTPENYILAVLKYTIKKSRSNVDRNHLSEIYDKFLRE